MELVVCQAAGCYAAPCGLMRGYICPHSTTSHWRPCSSSTRFSWSPLRSSWPRVSGTDRRQDLRGVKLDDKIERDVVEQTF